MLGLPEQLSLFKLPVVRQAAQHKLRHLQIGNRIVAYTLRQGQGRRRLSLAIDERGLIVGAPGRVALAEIEDFIRSHAGWVQEKLDEYSETHARRYLTVRDGTHLPILGGQVAVRIVTGANRCRWQESELLLEARPGADCDALARRALQRRALDVFTERLAIYGDLLGREPVRLGLSGARTRWGSCSAKSGIRLNWRLIHLPVELVDYVVAHELAHLVEMNHSPRFWAVVEGIYPGWRQARCELKRRGAEIPLI